MLESKYNAKKSASPHLIGAVFLSSMAAFMMVIGWIFIASILILALLLMPIIAVRLWWLRRRMPETADASRRNARFQSRSCTIDGHYTIIN